MQEPFHLTVNLKRFLWQCLIAMATDDLREPTDFINWLIYAEAKRRGIAQTPLFEIQETSDSITDL